MSPGQNILPTLFLRNILPELTYIYDKETNGKAFYDIQTEVEFCVYNFCFLNYWGGVWVLNYIFGNDEWVRPYGDWWLCHLSSVFFFNKDEASRVPLSLLKPSLFKCYLVERYNEQELFICLINLLISNFQKILPITQIKFRFIVKYFFLFLFHKYIPQSYSLN